MNILSFIIGFLYINVLDKLVAIFLSRGYAKKCNYNCKECGMWSCVNDTKYEKGNYIIGIYDNYKNVCGKKKGA